jgi:hypothetical protein
MRKSAMGPKVVDKMAGPCELRTADLYRVKGQLTTTLNNVDNDGGCKSTSKCV